MFNPFTKRGAGTALLPDQSRREGLVIRLAMAACGTSAAALAFLNTDNCALGGRPIDLARASDEGLLCVESALTGLERI